MIAGERKTLPERTGDLFDFAFAAYARRIGLYVTVAAIGFVIQAAVAAALSTAPGTTTLLATALLNVIVDAFIAGVVTLGVLTDIGKDGGEGVGSRAVVDAALRRFILLVAVNCLVTMTMVVVSPVPAKSSDLPMFFLLLPVVVVIYGTLGFATVFAAGDRTDSQPMLFVRSIGQSFRIAMTPGNLGRTALLGVCVLLVILLEDVMRDQFIKHHFRGVEFWANIPIDALVVGPIQAIFTIFSLDFMRRADAAARS